MPPVQRGTSAQTLVLPPTLCTHLRGCLPAPARVCPCPWPAARFQALQVATLSLVALRVRSSQLEAAEETLSSSAMLALAFGIASMCLLEVREGQSGEWVLCTGQCLLEVGGGACIRGVSARGRRQ